MKYIREYSENSYEENFKLEDKSFWYIERVSTFLKIAFEIILDWRVKNSLYRIYDELCKVKDKEYGIYLYYGYKKFGYFYLNDEKDKINKKELLSNNGYVYKGEIINKPGRILVNTLEIETDKYNL
jgi:hypothetical protein